MTMATSRFLVLNGQDLANIARVVLFQEWLSLASNKILLGS